MKTKKSEINNLQLISNKYHKCLNKNLLISKRLSKEKQNLITLLIKFNQEKHKNIILNNESKKKRKYLRNKIICMKSNQIKAGRYYNSMKNRLSTLSVRSNHLRDNLEKKENGLHNIGNSYKVLKSKFNRSKNTINYMITVVNNNTHTKKLKSHKHDESEIKLLLRKINKIHNYQSNLYKKLLVPTEKSQNPPVDIKKITQSTGYIKKIIKTFNNELNYDIEINSKNS